jgi:hypothetical protein
MNWRSGRDGSLSAFEADAICVCPIARLHCPCVFVANDAAASGNPIGIDKSCTTVRHLPLRRFRRHSHLPMTEPNPKRRKTRAPSLQSASAIAHFDREDAVTLLVGAEKRELLAHADYIAFSSACFKAALRKEWLEGQTRTVPLPVESYEDMTTYLRYIYSAQLPCRLDVHQLNQQPTAGDNETIQSAYTALSEFYVLGHRLMDDAVRKAAVTEIHYMFVRCLHRLFSGSLYTPGPGSIDIIWNGTLEGDPARRLIIDIHIKCPRDLSQFSEFDPVFLFDLAQAYTQKSIAYEARGVDRTATLNVDDYTVWKSNTLAGPKTPVQ